MGRRVPRGSRGGGERPWKEKEKEKEKEERGPHARTPPPSMPPHIAAPSSTHPDARTYLVLGREGEGRNAVFSAPNEILMDVFLLQVVHDHVGRAPRYVHIARFAGEDQVVDVLGQFTPNVLGVSTTCDYMTNIIDMYSRNLSIVYMNLTYDHPFRQPGGHGRLSRPAFSSFPAPRPSTPTPATPV